MGKIRASMNTAGKVLYKEEITKEVLKKTREYN